MTSDMLFGPPEPLKMLHRCLLLSSCTSMCLLWWHIVLLSRYFTMPGSYFPKPDYRLLYYVDWGGYSVLHSAMMKLVHLYNHWAVILFAFSPQSYLANHFCMRSGTELESGTFELLELRDTIIRSNELWSLITEKLYDLIKYSCLQRFNEDDIIIRQGTIGDRSVASLLLTIITVGLPVNWKLMKLVHVNL